MEGVGLTGNQAPYSVLDSCRSCGGSELRPVLSLGDMPLTDAYLLPDEVDREALYPLDVVFCPACSLVQILQSVSPEEMFVEYFYYSSFSNALIEHSRGNAERLIADRKLGADSLVVEIASNDGYMLRHFAKEGIPVLGIDPARGPAEVAEAAGIHTLTEFFGEEIAQRLKDEGTRADVILANNVLAHVPDLNEFVEGIAILLKDDGVAVIESPYVRDLVEHTEFDTIYHEHLCYYSVHALTELFARHGLTLSEVEHYPIHGGSLRLYITKNMPRGASVEGYLADERSAGLTEYEYYENFADSVRRIQESLRTTLKELKEEGKRVAAYGAAAKGTILLNSAGVGTDLVDFVVDRNDYKQGRLLPGVHLPIRDPNQLLEDMPDYVVLLSWNFKDEILEQQGEFRARGGKFIVPIPSLEIL